MKKQKWLILATSGALALGIAACGGDDGGDSGGDGLGGTIRIDGSSTVAPLAEAAGEEFNAENSGVRVTVGTSGTGGGFEKFCAGETDISNASRQIKEEERQLCEENGVQFEEISVANDALTVVVNPDNPVTCLSVDQLSQIWGPGSDVDSWGQVEGLDAEFDESLQLFGPGTDSGTFDYFTEAVNGEEGAQRTKYNNVGEDDNATVTGVSGSTGGMGYFGYSFYTENEGTLKALEVDGGEGCVAPSEESVQDGSYTPLGRQLFMYPSADALQREEVDEFIRYFIDSSQSLSERTGFIPMTEEQQQEQHDKVAALAGGDGSAEETPAE